MLAIIAGAACMNVALGQDLVVTSGNDSLNCKITDVDKDYLHFTFMQGQEVRHTLLPLDKVKDYEKDYFAKPEIPPDQNIKLSGSHPRVRAGAYGGWSYMTAKAGDGLTPSAEEYVKNLKTGHHWGADISFFTSENIGFGLAWSMFRTTNVLDGVSVLDTLTGQVRIGRLMDDMTIQYIGPTFCTAISSASGKSRFMSVFSLGYMPYKNNAVVVDQFTLKSWTVGLLLDLGYEMAIAKDLYLGLSASWKGGTLNHYQYTNGSLDGRIELDAEELVSISRIDLSAGIRWSR